MGYATTTHVFYGTFIERGSEIGDLFERYVEHGTPKTAAPGVEVDIIGNECLGEEQIAIRAAGSLVRAKSEQGPKKIEAPGVDFLRVIVSFLQAHGVALSGVAPIGWYLAARTS